MQYKVSQHVCLGSSEKVNALHDPTNSTDPTNKVLDRGERGTDKFGQNRFHVVAKMVESSVGTGFLVNWQMGGGNCFA